MATSKKTTRRTAKRPTEIAFDYIKSNFFRVIHADGAFGGLAPNGNIHMALFSERQAIPTKVVYSVEGTGIGPEISDKREEREALVREVEVDAWQINGVHEVFNELQVTDRGGVSDYLTDARIATQLRFKLMRDGDIASINYTIEAINKIVYLIGIAQSQQELERVTGHARTISGVSKVVSYVILKDDDRRL